MELKEAIQLLKDYNHWRRYDGEISESPNMPNPSEIGNAIDLVICKYENLFISGVSKSVAKEYAEFCVRCDREGLQLLELDDYIKQYYC